MVLQEFDYQRRIGITEAPVELVDPTKRVIKIAMKKLGGGRVDNLGRQKVNLLDPEKKRVYELCDVFVTKESFLGSKVKVVSNGLMKTGLFIEGHQLNESGSPVRELFGFVLARDPNLVETQADLTLIRDVDPEKMVELSESLLRAKKISKKEYEKITQRR